MIVCTAGLGLAACANPRVDAALFAQRALIGMPKTMLLSCAGVPARSARVDALEFFTYRADDWSGRNRTSVGVFGGSGRSGFGFGTQVPLFETEVAGATCEATFTLRNDRVERIVYGGDPSGIERLSLCHRIVENCLALVPQQPPPVY